MSTPACLSLFAVHTCNHGARGLWIFARSSAGASWTAIACVVVQQLAQKELGEKRPFFCRSACDRWCWCWSRQRAVRGWLAGQLSQCLSLPLFPNSLILLLSLYSQEHSREEKLSSSPPSLLWFEPQSSERASSRDRFESSKKIPSLSSPFLWLVLFGERI